MGCVVPANKLLQGSNWGDLSSLGSLHLCVFKLVQTNWARDETPLLSSRRCHLTCCCRPCLWTNNRQINRQPKLVFRYSLTFTTPVLQDSNHRAKRSHLVSITEVLMKATGGRHCFFPMMLQSRRACLHMLDKPTFSFILGPGLILNNHHLSHTAVTLQSEAVYVYVSVDFNTKTRHPTHLRQ